VKESPKMKHSPWKKSNPIIFPAVVILKELPKVNNHLIGEKSANLVTLAFWKCCKVERITAFGNKLQS
jgi:hypothetical protein